MNNKRLSLKISHSVWLLSLTAAISFPCFATEVKRPGLVSGWYRVAEQESGQRVRLVSSSDSIYIDTVRCLIAEDFEDFEISPSLLSPEHYYLSMAITRQGREKLISMHALSENTKIAFVAYKKVWQIEQVSNHISNPIFTITTADLAERNCRSLIIDFNLTRKWPDLRTGLLRHQTCHNKRKQLQSYRDSVNQVELDNGKFSAYYLRNGSVDYQVGAAALTVRMLGGNAAFWSDSIRFELTREGVVATYRGKRFNLSTELNTDALVELQAIPVQLKFERHQLKQLSVASGAFSISIEYSDFITARVWNIQISNGDYTTRLESSYKNRGRLKLISMEQAHNHAIIHLSSYFRSNKFVQFFDIKYFDVAYNAAWQSKYPLLLLLDQSFNFSYNRFGKLRRKHSSPKMTDSLCN